MLLAPLNFVFSLHLSPVFQWEAAKADEGAAAEPADTALLAAEAQTHRAEQSPPEADLRLVFKGYEWRPCADCTSFPRSNWESCLAAGSDLANDQVARQGTERKLPRTEVARHQDAPVKAPDQAHAAAGGAAQVTRVSNPGEGGSNPS